MAGVISDSFEPLPPPLEEKTARARLAELEDDGHPLAALARRDERVANLLLAVLGSSPFLSRLLMLEPAFAFDCFTTDSTALFEGIVAQANRSALLERQDAIMRELRLSRRRAALLVALADIAGAWPLEEVMARLTAYADAAIAAALRFVLRRAKERGRITSDDAGRCGLAVFSMGKGGAGELNYSSDVDLIFLFDPARAPLAGRREAETFFVRLVRRLVNILAEITGEGQVMRVDLRLRPDPGSTPVALSVEAALAYYFTLGQTWERAAWIKGRVCAGDRTVGEGFLRELSPWIWRKYPDYAAIADVHALKRRIHAVKGHGEITVPGHNLKLGRGGIREIEFFVQTQQLIAGGRHPELRGRRTLAMLEALAEGGWVTREAARELRDAYARLRTWEHRLQMVNDLQTHTLPSSEDELARFARFAGFDSRPALEETVRATLRTVRRHYDALFAQAAETDEEAARLAGALLAEEPDEAVLGELAALGFARPETVAETVRRWFSGQVAALRSERARERLRSLLPALLRRMGESGEADQALAAFDRFLNGLPAGLQLFSLLAAHPQLMELLLLILGSAPVLAGELTRKPRLFAGLIEGALSGPPPTRAEHEDALRVFARPDLPFEEVLDRARIHVSEQKFIIGTRLIAETLNVREAAAAYTALAEATLAHMLAAVRREMVRLHGEIAGARSAIVALGKLGSREMTHTSDLDLVVIHDYPPDAEESTPSTEQRARGERIRPLPPSLWFTRLTKRLITALTAPTAEGVLYEVDMRLRPSGSQGPVATHVESFRRYHERHAWLWEHLALTRARAVAGDAALCREVDAIIHETLTRGRAAEEVRAAVVDMRRRILKEKPAASVWDIKSGEGGLIDVEFIAQGLALIVAHERPDVLRRNTRAVLRALMEAGALNEAEGALLLQAARLYHRLMHAERLCTRPGDKIREEKLVSGVARMLARALEAPDVSRARAVVTELRGEVSALFTRLMGE